MGALSRAKLNGCSFGCSEAAPPEPSMLLVGTPKANMSPDTAGARFSSSRQIRRKSSTRHPRTAKVIFLVGKDEEHSPVLGALVFVIVFTGLS